jgi:hypothetical protein
VKLKELRPLGGNVRVLFAFDRHRTAIPIADGLYEARKER